MGLTAEERVQRALAAFERGDRRAAWESLRTMARREPGEPAYRRALVTTYRAAGHLDQSARWGASEPSLLDERERRILHRAAARAASEGEFRAYLAIPGALPPEVAQALPSCSDQFRRRRHRVADELAIAAGIVAAVLVGPALAIGLGVTLVQAFLGHPAAFSAAQITATIVLFGAVGLGVLLLLVSALRGWWVRAALLLIVVAAGVVVLGGADLTSMTPFG
ncbi:hypothetical protein ACLBWP_09500 [Microbacterium sp. M1A1_1b]